MFEFPKNLLCESAKYLFRLQENLLKDRKYTNSWRLFKPNRILLFRSLYIQLILISSPCPFENSGYISVYSPEISSYWIWSICYTLYPTNVPSTKIVTPFSYKVWVCSALASKLERSLRQTLEPQRGAPHVYSYTVIGLLCRYSWTLYWGWNLGIWQRNRFSHPNIAEVV